MTSGNFSTVPLSSIIIDDSIRQRRSLSGIEELAASIREAGLIQPPVITREYVLVSGRRRCAAMLSLGWLETPVQFTDEVDEDRLQLLELEENAKRVDLSWQDQMEAITRYHAIRMCDSKSWRQEDTAKALSLHPTTVSENLNIAKTAMQEPSLNILQAESYSTAKGLSRRFLERRQSTGIASILGIEPPPSVPAPASDLREFIHPPKLPLDIITTDFEAWLATNDRLFNFIHCDFPYGINTGSKTSGQSATKTMGEYDDSPEVYWNLLAAFEKNIQRFVEPSAHLIFWYSMKFHNETKGALEGMGWKVDPFPLIWHKSDNAGIIPDVNRGPRRTYETAFFCSRGDRKITRPVANSFASPSVRDFHAHEKSNPMLDHFLRMVVDSSTVMLDPTCGSGGAVKVSAALGASFSLGLELNPEYAERARKNLGL